MELNWETIDVLSHLYLARERTSDTEIFQMPLFGFQLLLNFSPNQIDNGNEETIESAILNVLNQIETHK